MASTRTVAVFGITHPWMREMVLKATPPEFDVKFIDMGDPGQVETFLPQADFLVTGSLPAKWLPLLRRCRLVQHQGVGYDGVDAEGLAKLGIPLSVTPEGTVVGVAEHVILLILALYKQLGPVRESMRRGEFDSIAWRPGCHFLYEKTLGIVGFGRIGRRVAQLAHPFDARIVYHDVLRADEGFEKSVGATPVPFDDLLVQSDVISVHTPLMPETNGLFGARQFAQMKPGAIFINTSRGGTYDMDALYEALRSGQLGGAGLDVFNPEPPPADHPILQLPNVICTPHMATGTVEAHLQKAKAQFDNFTRVLHGQPPLNLVVLPKLP
ncbi:MAG: 2-hydroxyacid dehydrogenase [Chloroflexota bacterium]